MKQGTLVYDHATDRYDIRFDLDCYYGGLHCGECFDVMVGGKWKSTRILSAFNEGEFTLDEVQGLLQTLFDRQYILTEDVEVEVRYRTETRTDSEGNREGIERFFP